MDKILIGRLPLSCRIGISEQEQEKPQPIIADVEVHLDLRKAGKTDDLEDTIDYVKVCKTLAAVSSRRTYRLVENLAETMASEVLQVFPAARVTIRLEKPQALAPEGAAYAAVEIERIKHG